MRPEFPGSERNAPARAVETSRGLKKILIVDDDPVSRDLLLEVLRKEGYAARAAASGEEAAILLEGEDFPLVLSDVRMRAKSGFDLLREIKDAEREGRRPRSVCILMTGFGSMDGAVDAFKQDAFDYISKPFAIDDLRALVGRALKHAEFLRGSAGVELRAGDPEHGSRLARSLTGRSPRIVEVYRMIARASLAASSVLLTGEVGTGKALVARAIHENGARKGKPYRKFADREDFLDFEAKLERAAAGTVVIEELAELGPSEQTKLLRGMETAEARGWDIRWIAGSRVPVAELSRGGRVRGELLDRLNVIAIEMPPLRLRIEDLPELVDAFVARYAAMNAKTVSHVSEGAMARFREYEWPGNVRELERLIEKAVAMSAGSVLELEDFPELSREGSASPAGAVAAPASLESVERAHILRVLTETGFNKSRASEILGIDRATLYRKAKAYGIELKPGAGA